MELSFRQRVSIKRWVQKITEALARHDCVSVESLKLHLLPDDQKFLLMNWKTWSLRYAVNLDFIVHTLMGYFDKIRRFGTGFFGVPVRNLTGQRAQEVIEQEVAVTYPAGECYAVRKSEIRSRLLNHRLKKFTHVEKDWKSDIKEYQKRIQRVHELDAELPKKFTRAWRTNPLIRIV